MTKNKTTGYKAFNKDWTCRGFQYKVGKTYTMKEKPKCCNQGFHFCTNIADCFKHYANNPESTKIALVEALGDIDKEDDASKCCTNKIKIVKEISFAEAYELGNQGKNNTGFGNTGDLNTGYRNTGYLNTGDCNTGDRNTGDRNTGDWNTGSYNACNHSAGMFNTKEQPMYLFNKPTDFTRDEFKNVFPNEHRLLFNSPFPLTEWITESNMTDEEKEANPSYKTAEGYLKKRTYHEAWRIMWDSWTKKQQKSIKKLPNFDKDIFKEITGIEVE